MWRHQTERGHLSVFNHPSSQVWKLRPGKGTLPSPRSHRSQYRAGNRTPGLTLSASRSPRSKRPGDRKGALQTAGLNLRGPGNWSLRGTNAPGPGPEAAPLKGRRHHLVHLEVRGHSPRPGAGHNAPALPNFRQTLKTQYPGRQRRKHVGHFREEVPPPF